MSEALALKPRDIDAKRGVVRVHGKGGKWRSVGLVIVLVIGGVIFPAIWSSKRTRRTAALNVLDRILRWRR